MCSSNIYLSFISCVDIWVTKSKVITFALTGLHFLKDTITAINFLCKADAKTFDFCSNIRSSVVSWWVFPLQGGDWGSIPRRGGCFGDSCPGNFYSKGALYQSSFSCVQEYLLIFYYLCWYLGAMEQSYHFCLNRTGFFEEHLYCNHFFSKADTKTFDFCSNIRSSVV